MGLHHGARLVDALRDARQAEFLEAAREVPLMAIERDDLRIVADAIERRERARRYALGGGLAPECRQPGIEARSIIPAASAGRGAAQASASTAADSKRRMEVLGSGCPNV
jgi:hypothetical protein